MKDIDQLIKLLNKRYLRYTNNISVTNKKLSMKHIDTKFLSQIQRLTLEELIAIKLESMSSITNGKLYFPIRKIMFNIVQRAVVLIAMSATGSLAGASLILGIPIAQVTKLLKGYDLHDRKETENFKRENCYIDSKRSENE